MPWSPACPALGKSEPVYLLTWTSVLTGSCTLEFSPPLAYQKNYVITQSICHDTSPTGNFGLAWSLRVLVTTIIWFFKAHSSSLFFFPGTWAWSLKEENECLLKTLSLLTKREGDSGLRTLCLAVREGQHQSGTVTAWHLGGFVLCGENKEPNFFYRKMLELLDLGILQKGFKEAARK